MPDGVRVDRVRDAEESFVADTDDDAPWLIELVDVHVECDLLQGGEDDCDDDVLFCVGVARWGPTDAVVVELCVVVGLGVRMMIDRHVMFAMSHTLLVAGKHDGLSQSTAPVVALAAVEHPNVVL